MMNPSILVYRKSATSVPPAPSHTCPVYACCHARPPPATCVPGTRPAPRFKSGGTHQTAVRRAPSPAAPRTAPRACSTRPARKENRTDLPTARPPDRPTSRPPDRPTTRPPDRPTARPPDRPTARPPDRTSPSRTPRPRPRTHAAATCTRTAQGRWVGGLGDGWCTPCVCMWRLRRTCVRGRGRAVQCSAVRRVAGRGSRGGIDAVRECKLSAVRLLSAVRRR